MNSSDSIVHLAIMMIGLPTLSFFHSGMTLNCQKLIGIWGGGGQNYHSFLP